MLILGLTGGIACGKSHVSDTLRRLGAVIVDGDLLSRELTAPDGPALGAIQKVFGDGMFREGGSLDRAALGKRVFGDTEGLDLLNGLMRPMLRSLIDVKIGEAQKSDAPVCVLDMPLLYEEGLDKLCGRVWCVTVPLETQLDRLIDRDGLDVADALKRIMSQMPTAEKARRADVVIDTDRSLEETEAAVRALYDGELARLEEADHAG